MTIDRRAFLGSAGLVAAAIVAAPVSAFAAAPRSRELVRSTFTPMIGRTGTAAGAGKRAHLQLVAIRDLAGAPAGSQASFSLQFRSSTALPDGLYTLAHPSIGQARLFLCGIDRGSSRRYEAVVNNATG